MNNFTSKPNVFARESTQSHNQQDDTVDGIRFSNYRDINSENSNTDTDDDDDDHNNNNRCWTLPPSSPQETKSLVEMMNDLVLRVEAFFQIKPNPKYNHPRHCNENFEDCGTDDDYGRINSSSQTSPTSPQGPRPAQGPLIQPIETRVGTFKQSALTSPWRPSIQQGGKLRHNDVYKDTWKALDDMDELIYKLKTFTIPTNSQTIAVEHVLGASCWDWDAIVGVPGIKGLNYETDADYDEAVDTAFILLYMLTDPRFNDNENAGRAHQSKYTSSLVGVFG